MERYRFHSDGALFYVTFSVVDWLPIFVEKQLIVCQKRRLDGLKLASLNDVLGDEAL